MGRQLTEEQKARKYAYTKQWRKDNPDKVKAATDAWRAANPEKVNRKEYKAAYHAANRERLNKISAAWYAANKDKAKERQKEYQKKRYLEHPEIYKSSSIKWRDANVDRVKEKNSLWWKENREKSNLYSHNRRALIKGNGGKLSPDISQKLLLFQKCKCALCKKSLKEAGHHLDHIVPISRGGVNEDRNIQLLCHRCNSRKHAKPPIVFAQEMGYLL